MYTKLERERERDAVNPPHQQKQSSARKHSFLTGALWFYFRGINKSTKFFLHGGQRPRTEPALEPRLIPGLLE